MCRADCSLSLTASSTSQAGCTGAHHGRASFSLTAAISLLDNLPITLHSDFPFHRSLPSSVLYVQHSKSKSPAEDSGAIFFVTIVLAGDYSLLLEMYLVLLFLACLSLSSDTCSNEQSLSLFQKI